VIIKRYALPVMQKHWLREESKFEHWLDVELAVLRAREELGMAPKGAYEIVRKHAAFTLERIAEIEAEVDHDLIAFVTNIRESLETAGVGHLCSELHKEITSYDVEDPAMILMLRFAVHKDIVALQTLEETILARALEHKWTWMIMRTHGQFAEPSTFGHLLMVFAEEVRRCRLRLELVFSTDLAEGKISGAVGSFAGLNPAVEQIALNYLGLKPARAETQILQRDRHASLLCALAVCGGVFEQIAKTFWVMMRSEVRELREPRKRKQKGSSAMPGKRNPILTERLMGMSRLLRADALCALENIATFEGREISQSSVERHIFARSTSLVHYMATKLSGLVEGLEVFPEQMLHNLTEESLGVWAGQRVRHALEEKGIHHEAAYRYVQACSFKAEAERTHLRDVLRRTMILQVVENSDDDNSAEDLLDPNILQSCFDHEAYAMAGIKHIFEVQAS
jgi:adenylosuccinate lyase